MSNYTKLTDFAIKDDLPSGAPLKIVRGREIDTEFNNIASAIASKADTAFVTETFVTAALQAVYPVGSVYINAGVSTSPATLLGFGTWVAFGAGRVMVGLDGGDPLFSTMEGTGGGKDAGVVAHNHIAVVTDPGHVHALGNQFSPGPASGLDGGNVYPIINSTTGIATTNISVGISSAGSPGTNANLQPYITVAMWKRTA